VAECFQRDGTVNECIVGFVNAAGGADADRAENFVATLGLSVVGDKSPRPCKIAILMLGGGMGRKSQFSAAVGTGKSFPLHLFSWLLRCTCVQVRKRSGRAQQARSTVAKCNRNWSGFRRGSFD
jgi:hypothetical protein